MACEHGEAGEDGAAGDGDGAADGPISHEPLETGELLLVISTVVIMAISSPSVAC